MIRRLLPFLALVLVPTPAFAERVPVKLVWDGTDVLGGILSNRLRGMIAGSPDKRETSDATPGLSVILQTIDPVTEFEGGANRRGQMTVYSLVINFRADPAAPETFGSAALGYCAIADLTSCSAEILAAIDQEIGRHGLR